MFKTFILLEFYIQKILLIEKVRVKYYYTVCRKNYYSDFNFFYDLCYFLLFYFSLKDLLLNAR